MEKIVKIDAENIEIEQPPKTVNLKEIDFELSTIPQKIDFHSSEIDRLQKRKKELDDLILKFK